MGFKELEQDDIGNYATHTNVFNQEDQIETDPLTPPNNWFGCDNKDISENIVPTTNSVDFAFKVEEVVKKSHYVSGHVIINQCGSLLTRNNHRINDFKS